MTTIQQKEESKADDQTRDAGAFLAALQQSHQHQRQHLQHPHSNHQQQPRMSLPSALPSSNGNSSSHLNVQSGQTTGRRRASEDDDDGADASSDVNSKGEQPPRKAARRSSAASNTTKEAHGAAAAASSSADTTSGPPYICPTCQTSYSRLEYLRRHERRHQDIRPFVCECGKGFSRSDVLSRHKRQCHFHLTGEQPSTEAHEAASKKTRKAPAPPKSKKKDPTEDSEPNDPDGSQDDNGRKPSVMKPKREPSNGTSHTPPPFRSQQGLPAGQPGGPYPAATQPGPPPPLLPHTSGHHASAPQTLLANVPGAPLYYASGAPPPPSSQQSQDSSGHQNSDFSRSGSLMSAIQFALDGTTYAPSPESNASLNSRNSSPRLHYRDNIPYHNRVGSSGTPRQQSSLRKGTLDPFHAQPPWEVEHNRSSPAPAGSASVSRSGSIHHPSLGHHPRTASVQGSNMPGHSFVYGANEFGNQVQTGTSNQPLSLATDSGSHQQNSQSGSAGAPQRFAMSTGPLSPFSGVGLNSSNNPYLASFSAARDTPLVASPSRGVHPGTPTSTLNGNPFDFAMRPPSKPASSTTPGRSGSANPASATDSKGSAALKRKGSLQRPEDPSTPSASAGVSAATSSSLSALADFVDDQQRNAANGLLTLLGGGAETPSRFVRGDANTSTSQSDAARNVATSLDANPGTTSATASSNPFFDAAVTPGPGNFLLRLQGPEGIRKSGMTTSSAQSASNGPLMTPATAGMHSATSAAITGSGFDTPSNVLGPMGPWDYVGGESGLNLGTPGHANNVNWLMSPSIQALISSFEAGNSPAGPGEGGSYFPLSRRPSGLTTTPPITALGSAASNKTASPAPQDPGSDSSSAQDATVNDVTGPLSSAASSVSSSSKSALDRAFEDVNNPFFIPERMFQTCVSLTKWELPSLTRMSMLAMHGQQNLLKHAPILHEPTFRIDTTPCCVAFACCLLGRHEAGRRWWAGQETIAWKKSANAPKESPIAPHIKEEPSSGSLESAEGAEKKSERVYDEEDGQEVVRPVVMTEKMDSLMSSFNQRCTKDKDRVSVTQTLTLFQINMFLSERAQTRDIAAFSHGGVVEIARKSGFFEPNAEHVSREINYTPAEALEAVTAEHQDLNHAYSFLASYYANFPDNEKVWRRWCDFEGRRRTVFVLFEIDTVCSLDCGLPMLIEMEEIRHLPLPAADSIWRASTAQNFKEALDKNKGLTFDESMQELLLAPDPEDESAAFSGPLVGAHGPFARLIMIMAILRGIVQLIRNRDGGESPKTSPLKLWLDKIDPKMDASAESSAPSAVKKEDDADDWLIDTFKRALSRWRAAWDADELCVHASSPVTQAAKGEATKRAKELFLQRERASRGGSASIKEEDFANPQSKSAVFTSKTASGAIPVCEDALPFYWLSHVLLGHATTRRVKPSSARGSVSPANSRKSSQVKTSKQTPPTPDPIKSPADQNIALGESATDKVNGNLSVVGMGESESTRPRSPSTARKSSVPDFKSMLRFAKTFVSSGEGTNGTTAAGGLLQSF